MKIPPASSSVSQQGLHGNGSYEGANKNFGLNLGRALKDGRGRAVVPPGGGGMATSSHRRAVSPESASSGSASPQGFFNHLFLSPHTRLWGASQSTAPWRVDTEANTHTAASFVTNSSGSYHSAHDADWPVRYDCAAVYDYLSCLEVDPNDPKLKQALARFEEMDPAALHRAWHTLNVSCGSILQDCGVLLKRWARKLWPPHKVHVQLQEVALVARFIADGNLPTLHELPAHLRPRGLPL